MAASVTSLSARGGRNLRLRCGERSVDRPQAECVMRLVLVAREQQHLQHFVLGGVTRRTDLWAGGAQVRASSFPRSQRQLCWRHVCASLRARSFSRLLPAARRPFLSHDAVCVYTRGCAGISNSARAKFVFECRSFGEEFLVLLRALHLSLCVCARLQVRGNSMFYSWISWES
jgi:hypothetical protein